MSHESHESQSVLPQGPAVAVGVEDAHLIAREGGDGFEWEISQVGGALDERGPLRVLAFFDVLEKRGVARDWREIEADDAPFQQVPVVQVDEVLDGGGKPEAPAIAVPGDGPRHIG